MTPRFFPGSHGAALARATVAIAAGSLLLTGCSAAVPLQPAADAVNPACADLVVHLPASVADQPQRETNAQGTGAWGEPSATVLLHCGVDVPGPTTDECVNINGVDWINDDTDAPTYRFTTYGRTPATEVVIDSDKVAGSTVLVDLANAVSRLPSTRACVGAEDLVLPDGSGPAPATEAPVSPAPSPTP
jgi:hypothetical protein